jgi:hypothetical protein
MRQSPGLHAGGLASLIREGIHNLMLGEVGPTEGDLRRIIYGHFTRLAIWDLRKKWNKEVNTEQKLEAVGSWIEQFGGRAAVEKHLDLTSSGLPRIRVGVVREPEQTYGHSHDEISF